METKWGITTLLVGSYLLAFGLAGINANSGGAVAIFTVVLVLGFVVTGWSIVLPWDGARGRHRGEHASPGPVPKP